MQCGRNALGWCLIGKDTRRQRKRTRCGGPLLYASQEESVAPACWRQGKVGTIQALARKWAWLAQLTVNFDTGNGTGSREQSKTQTMVLQS